MGVRAPKFLGSVYQIAQDAVEWARANGHREVDFEFNGVTVHAYPDSRADDIAQIAMLRLELHKARLKGYTS